MKKYTKEELLKMDAVDVYKLVLEGKHIKIFPQGFWEQPEAKQNAIKCTRYLIDNTLCYKEEEIKEKVNMKFFKNHKLSGMLQYCFNNSPTKAIIESYPEKEFNIWEFKCIPRNYWTKEMCILATRWLIDTKLKLNDEQLKEQLSYKLFKDNGLYSMLRIHFDNSPINAIIESYPEKSFNIWEFKSVPNGYWTINRGIQATRWLIDTKLKLNDEELKEQLSANLFKDNGLSGMLGVCFDYSPFKAIMESYPQKNFNIWEFKASVPKDYWGIDTGKQATKWLIETKLRLTDEKLKEQLSANLFKDNGLSGMLSHCFDNSPFKAINCAYPNKFKKEDFKNYR